MDVKQVKPVTLYKMKSGGQAMPITIDRTNEIEQRCKAIQIGSQDTCSFWKSREDSMFQLHQCWYCSYSKFNREKSDTEQVGLCGFKRGGFY